MSGCLFKCDGQYVGFRGAIIFRVLFVIKLFNARPLVLVVLDPQKGCFELVTASNVVVVECQEILTEVCSIYF